MQTAPNRVNGLHSFLNVVEILAAHSILILWFIFGPDSTGLPLFIVLTLIASLIHQRMTSEWIHESAHFNIIRNRKVNDLFTDVFLGFFLLNDIQAHRHSHFQHHRMTQFLVNDDPDTNLLLIRNKREFRKAFLHDLLGISAIKMFLGRQELAQSHTKKRKLVYIYILIHAMFFGSLIYVGRPDVYILYYASLGLLYPALNRIRVYGQHAEVHNGNVKLESTASSRTFKTELMGRVFIHSPLMQYHHEHHLYPQIPFRYLKEMNLANKDKVNEYSLSHWQIIKALYKGLPE